MKLIEKEGKIVSESNKKERSRAYPVMPLDEAFSRITSINENLGLNGQFNRESIAVGMGYSSLSGASARAVAALVQYGLLEREKDQYSLSVLARKYLLPLDDNDMKDAIGQAALSPSLFADIYNAFKGQVIPRQFANRLIHEFGIQQKAAADVERIFRNTMETAGILKSNGILSAEATQETIGIPSAQPTGSSVITSTDMTPRQGQDGVKPEGYLSVELPSGLIISYSQNLAPAFAFGIFGQKLQDLDEAVSAYAQRSADKEGASDE